MPDVQHRAATLTFLIVAVFRTTRVDQAAEQLVRSVVDVVRPSVVRTEGQALRHAMVDVDRTGVIDALRIRGKARHAAQESLRLERTVRRDGIERRQRRGRGRERGRYRRSGEVHRQRSRAAGKCRLRVQLRLGEQLRAAGTEVPHFHAGVLEQLVLDAARPGVHLRLCLVEDDALRGTTSFSLVRRRNVHLEQTATRQEAPAGVAAACIRGGVVTRAPCRTAGQSARDVRILLGLKLRRQLQGREVLRDHVVGDAEAATDRPLAAAGRIPCEAQARSIVVDVRLRRHEIEARRSVLADTGGAVRNGIQGLQLEHVRNTEPLIADAQVQGQALRDLPVILEEPEERRLVAIGGAAAGSALREVDRHRIAHQVRERRVLPFTTATGQETARSDPTPSFAAELEGVSATRIGHLFDDLIHVLTTALR